MILKSVLLELRDLLEEALDPMDGRFAVSCEYAKDVVLVLTKGGAFEMELASGGTAGSALWTLAGDFNRAPSDWLLLWSMKGS